jgi:hypothetical protein
MLLLDVIGLNVFLVDAKQVPDYCDTCNLYKKHCGGLYCSKYCVAECLNMCCSVNILRYLF